jgi:hypothetical protein
MTGLSEIIDVHSHPILTFGQGAPVANMVLQQLN